MHLLCARLRLRFSVLHFCNTRRKYHFQILFVALNHPIGGVTFCRVTRRNPDLRPESGSRHPHVAVLSSADRRRDPVSGPHSAGSPGWTVRGRDPTRGQSRCDGRRGRGPGAGESGSAIGSRGVRRSVEIMHSGSCIRQEECDHAFASDLPAGRHPQTHRAAEAATAGGRVADRGVSRRPR